MYYRLTELETGTSRDIIHFHYTTWPDFGVRRVQWHFLTSSWLLCCVYYKLTELETGTSRDIIHFHYTTWPDFGVPESSMAFLNFLMVVNVVCITD